MYKIVVLVSGKGSTLDSLATHCADEVNGALCRAVEVSCVVADRECPARQVAEKHNLPFEIRKHDELFKDEGVDLWVMAGFLSKVKVPDHLYGRIINVHPSFLPEYGGKGMYGAKVHEAVIRDKKEFTGCTIHVVDDLYDHGPVIERMKIAVLPWDTASSLQDSVKGMEDMLYPRAILNHLRTVQKAKHRKSEWWDETPTTEQWFQEWDVPKFREKGWSDEEIAKIFGPLNR